MRQARFLSTIPAIVLAMTGTIASAQTTDFRDSFPDIAVTSPLGVNLQSGQFSINDTDLVMGPIQVGRRYQGQYSNTLFTMSMGANWDSSHPVFGIGHNLRGYMFWRTETTPTLTLNKIYINVEGTALQFLLTAQGTIRRWNIESKGWVLYASGADYILRHKSGRTYRFVDHAGIPAQSGGFHKPMVLDSVTNPDGSRLEYSYNSNVDLTSVYSSLGYRVNFIATPATNQITVCGFNLAITYAGATSNCAGAQQQVTYTFGLTPFGSRQITSITRVDGTVLTFQFNNRGLMTCATFPNSSTCRVTNEYWPAYSPTGEVSVGNSYDQVMRQTTAAGEVWNYEYDFSAYSGDAPPLTPADLEAGQRRYTYGAVVNPLGERTLAYFLVGYPEYIESPAGTVYYDHSGVRIGLVPQGSWPTTPFTFSYFSMVPTGVLYPEGNILRFNYDAAGNNILQRSVPKPGSGEAAIEVTRTYPTPTAFEVSSTTTTNLCTATSQVLCDKPTAATDALGNVTDFTYDPTHGGVLTETAPAVGGIRPQTRYVYVQRTPMVLNSSGGVVAAGPPVWVLASRSLCRTGAASGNGCAIAGDEVVTTFDYGPTTGVNTLLLRGQVEDANGLALRTCYQYDERGNRIATTAPEGTVGWTSCP